MAAFNVRKMSITSPPQNALFVNAIDWGTTIKLAGPGSRQYSAGKPFLGSANAFGDSAPKTNPDGWLRWMPATLSHPKAGPSVVIYSLGHPQASRN